MRKTAATRARNEPSIINIIIKHNYMIPCRCCYRDILARNRCREIRSNVSRCVTLQIPVGSIRHKVAFSSRKYSAMLHLLLSRYLFISVPHSIVAGRGGGYCTVAPSSLNRIIILTLRLALQLFQPKLNHDLKVLQF